MWFLYLKPSQGMQMVLRAVSAAEAPQSLELGIDIPGYQLSTKRGKANCLINFY